MAVRQINTAAFNYEMMLESINKSYKGKADITIDEYDSTAAPDVKVGSVFDVNGAIFIVEDSDITPTGYAGISSSTTFYLYWDVDPGAFIYSETAPTWNDALQGWYNSDDRAFFSMFKDSGDTLYQDKLFLLNQSQRQIEVENITINNAILFPAYGEVGSLVIAASTAWDDDTTYEPDTTVAGNTLIRMDETTEASLNARGATNIVFLANSANLGLTGTWRLLTRVRMVTDNNIPIGLLQRIA